MISLQRRCKKHRQSQVFSIRAGLTFEKINPEVLFYGTSGRDFMLFGVLPDSNNLQLMKYKSKYLHDKRAKNIINHLTIKHHEKTLFYYPMWINLVFLF